MLMKHFFNLPKSKLLLLTLLAVFAGGVSPAWAEELTVYDGTATSTTVPVNGMYVDTQGTISEFVMPAATLADMTGGTISKLTFYLKTSAEAAWSGAEFRVYMNELSAAHTYASYSASAVGEEGATTVYEGGLDATQSTMTIELTNPYTYNGGNLLVGVYVMTAGTYKSATFLGLSDPNYNYYSYSKGSGSYFLPKTSFTYEVSASFVAKPKNVTASNVADASATIGWTAGSEETSWEIGYGTTNAEPASTTIVTNTTYGLTGLTAETTYYVYVRAIKGENKSDWSVVNFTTKPAPISTFPFTESFTITSGIPANWNNDEGTATTYKWGYYASGHDGACVRYNSYHNQSGIWNALKTPAMNFPEGKIMQLSFWYKNPTGGDFSVYVSNDGGDTYTTSLATGLTGQTDWKQVEVTIPTGFTENVVIVFKGTSNYGSGNAYIDLDDVTVQEAPNEAKLSVETESIAFGMVSGVTSQAIAIKNQGAAQMTGLTVTYTATTGESDAITITPAQSNTTLDANSQRDITVAVNTERLGAFSGTIKIEATGQTTVEIPVSGYVLDDTKICETFASLPSRWTSSGSWTYNATTGAYGTSSSTTLTSPKIAVVEGETLTVSAKMAYAKTTYSNYCLKIEGSADNGTSWNAYTKELSTASDPALSTTDFTVVTLNDIPTTVNRLRITAYYAYINALNGFTYDDDPQLALYSNEALTTTLSSTTEKNFGFVTEAQEQKYYIKNAGTGQIDLTLEQADGFTAAVADAELGEGVSTALTITMAATEGLHNGTVTLTAKNHKTSEVLGTLTVAVNGAVAGTKNDINFASLSALPAGWETEKWTVTANSYVGNSTGTAYDLTSQIFTVAEGETMLVEAKGSASYYMPELNYSYKVGDGEWTEATTFSGVTYNDWKVFAITGVPAGQVRVKFTGKYVYIRRIYGFEAAAVPVMEFTAADKAFGMITADATSDIYTITNSGAGVLNNLSVACSDDNFEIAVADNAISIAANGGTVTFTVKLKTTNKGLHTGVVTVSGTNVESKTFNVSGYVADGDAIFETFATALPARWENTSAALWTISGGAAYAENYAYSGGYQYATLETPKIKVTEGQKLAISAKLGNGSGYVTIEGSTDNGTTWTAFSKKLSNDVLNNTSYTVVEISDIPATVNKLRLVGYYVYVNGFNGFAYDDNDPQFAMYSDEACTAVITEATNDWGFLSENKSAVYYVKNTGTGTMNISLGTVPAGFTAVLGKDALTAGENTTLTVSMANNAETNEGYHAGDIVLTAKDNAENALGTFTVTSSGVVVGSKSDINFASLTDFPAGWETSNWSISSGKATISYTSGSLTTGTYSVAEGESLVVEARKNSTSTYSTIALSYQYSTDGGSTWSTAKTITPSSTSYELIAISDIAANDNVTLKFTGTYIDIQRIYGYTTVAKPAMTLDKTADYNFGMQTADANYVITVTNSGTAVMENLAATLTSSDYTAVVSATTVAVGESATITVTQKFDASKGLATLADVLTITADGVASKTIKVSGQTRDPEKWYVDFASGSFPTESFLETGTWSVSSEAAYTGNTSTPSSIITKAIELAAGEKLQFEAKQNYSSGTLKVRYSTNGGATWSEYNDYSGQLTTSYTGFAIDLQNAEKVNAIFEFTGSYYVYLDNLYGGTLATDAPMLSVKKNGTAVESPATEDFGQILTETTVTYTFCNVGTGTLTITEPVSVTGDATATLSATELAAGQSATLTITMPVAAPYGEKSGVVTVTTSLGEFVINYKATTMDPDALNEQFASKPAGWYYGGNGYWKLSSGALEQSDSGSAEDLITEKLTVAGESDALTFEAARTTDRSASTFNVYTSQNRVDWTEVDLSDVTLTTSYQTITVKGLAAGDYYVKISGARVKVDNFLGWKKVSGITRDLYVTATSIPTAKQLPGAEITASATVTSLFAAEDGVYAKLFINGEVAGTAEAATAKLQPSTTTFSLTGNVPTVVGTYKAQIKLYYSDETEAFATAERDIMVDYASLALSETEAPTLEAGTYNVNMTRTYVEGWNSVCLPFEVAVSAIAEDAVAYEFAEYSTTSKELTFNKVTTLAAGKPYVIYTPATIESLEFKGVTIAEENVNAGTSESNGVVFQGTYASVDFNSLTGSYYGLTAGGKIGKMSSSALLKGFRGYFKDIPAGARVAFVGDGDVATGIYSISVDTTAPEGTYNLQGQKVQQLNKGGLYIVNGKKIVIK